MRVGPFCAALHDNANALYESCDMVTVGIIGASGYTGAELLRLAAQHPDFDVVYATGDTQAGTAAAALYPSLAGAYPTLVFESFDVERARGLDLVFLGLPHEASMALAPELVGHVGCVVDLSAAYRLKDRTQYPAYYGFEHDQPELLADAVYGLPEKYRNELKGAGLVATPGCYVTAATLALEPLVAAGAIETAGRDRRCRERRDRVPGASSATRTCSPRSTRTSRRTGC